MKKEIVISLVIILTVIVGNIFTQNYTKECIRVVTEDLETLKTEAREEEKNQKKIEEKINHIRNHWDEMQEKLAFYIEHDELEKVETQISALKGDIESKLYQDMLPEIEKCSFILEHIADKTTLNIKNIF